MESLSVSKAAKLIETSQLILSFQSTSNNLQEFLYTSGWDVDIEIAMGLNVCIQHNDDDDIADHTFN